MGPVLTVSPQALSLTLSLKGEGTVSATANIGFSRVARCAITYREARVAPSPFRERAGGEGGPGLDASPFASKLAPTKSPGSLEVQA
ncbi:hypothetical protein Pssp01_38830 [Pseudomonas sp. NBRC 100443]|nr:hypothetical protein Pssp01_38830 [Pseudomonas sp. NBRC 100443]